MNFLEGNSSGIPNSGQKKCGHGPLPDAIEGMDSSVSSEIEPVEPRGCVRRSETNEGEAKRLRMVEPAGSALTAREMGGDYRTGQS